MDPTTLEKQAQELIWRNVGQSAIKDYERLKEAYSPTFRRAGELLGFLPGNIAGVPMQASPLRAMLTTGLLGGAAGYGVGMLGEHLMPDTWERGRLRKTLGIVGALGGSAIGGVPGISNMMSGRSFNDNSQWQIPRPQNDAPFPGVRKFQPVKPLKNMSDDLNTLDMQPDPNFKAAADRYNTGADSAPTIDVNEFNQVVWADPRVSSRLPINMRAAATGLVETAAYGSDPNNKSIGPMDIARITAGMGTGYLSGALVGRGLGLLMGMPPETQDLLKTTGMWAGAVRSFVNTAFGL